MMILKYTAMYKTPEPEEYATPTQGVF
jgi:hypothetical protein